MKKTILSALILAASVSSTAIADTTFGVGLGSLYNGLGLNVGLSSDTGLVFGSLGCMGAFSSRSSHTNGESVTRDKKFESNCGIGLGYLDVSLLPGNQHGLGLSLGYTYDTDDTAGGSEYHLMPGYHYFFNGIGQRGLTLGIGARVTRSEADSADTGFAFNFGYQF